MISLASIAAAGGAFLAGAFAVDRLQPARTANQTWLLDGQTDVYRLTDGRMQPVLDRVSGLGNEMVGRVETSLSEGQGAIRRFGAAKRDQLWGTATDAESSFGQEIKATLSVTYNDVDEKYQRFMVKRVDPLLGRARSAQIGDITTGEEALVISSYEKALNRNLLYSLAAFGSVGLGVWLLPASLFLTVPLAFLLTVPIYYRAYDSLSRHRRVNHHILSAINVTGVWLGGFFVPATLGALIYYLAEKLLMVTQDRSYKGLANIFGQQPKSVWVVTDGVEVEIPFDQVQPGDIVVVSAGQMAPVDGVIVDGLASIDQHMLTGEAQPAEKTVGDTVLASTIVLAGQIQVRVEKAGSETVAAQIGTVLNRTASYQMSLQSKGSAIAHGAALPTLILGGLAWPLIGLEQGLAILNSGFGLNIRITAPIAMLNFLNIASRSGILIKDGRSLELLSEVDTIVFDKTGTLTLEQPHVAQIHVCHELDGTDTVDANALLRYAAAAEHRQAHPIAKAILEAAAAQELQLPVLESAQYEIGYGIQVRIEDRVIRVGSDRYMAAEGIVIPEEIETLQRTCHARGHSLVMVGIDDMLGGAIELQPTLRPEAKDVIADLHGRGFTLAIISGDQEEPTRRLAAELGIDQYFANTLPENKATLVEQLQAEGRSVCFVGDGINDSIALKKANVSISLRGSTTVATDTAQIVLMDQSLSKLTQLFTLATKFDKNLKVGFASAIIPGVINIGGIFLFHWGIYTSMFIYNLSLLNNLGIAMLPLLSAENDGDQ
ncbi:MAG: heavy metal translocating P-type ATPase [Caldilineaceae bacterium]